MPLDRAILDWQVIPPAPGRGGEGVEVVAVAARRDMLSVLMEAVRRAGLRLVGIDHSSFALIRALKGSERRRGAPDRRGRRRTASRCRPGTLYCHLGDITNLAVARESYCVFSRVLGFGIEGIAQSLAAKSSLSLEHARQWLLHVGLEDPIDQIERRPGDRHRHARGAGLRDRDADRRAAPLARVLRGLRGRRAGRRRRRRRARHRDPRARRAARARASRAAEGGRARGAADRSRARRPAA